IEGVDLVVTGAEVKQQCRRQRVVVVESKHAVMKEGPAGCRDLVRQAIRIAVGRRKLAIRKRLRPKEGNLTIAAYGLIQLQRRNNGGPLAEVGARAIVDQIAVGRGGK